MKTTIATIIAAIIMVVGTASAVTVTYNGNAAVDMNGTYYGGAADGSAVTMSIVPPVAVTEPVVTEEPVIDNTPEPVPTAPPAVDHIYANPTAATDHVMYQVYYVDGAIVSYYNMAGQIGVTGQNIPPGAEYYYTETRNRYNDYMRSYQDSIMLAEHAANPDMT